ncbi:Retrovirus-related Pol polyprotein from transposon TNT 1-94 [Vitis vinifera]|uniref:Retrovirus-related Pol polyprotein from transposon TNT 1-94 n=1 Tax=Vitis vinifera TaxID=29760 RepID=A0A438FUW0_VITVI|nr:Retrovirus-related Pol polyprotein from transposon TNT 1-94 [Vitis vinifera]
MLGPTTGNNVRLTKPHAFKARSDWAQFGAKDFGPLAGLAHEGSSNGGPDASSSSKLLRPGFTAKKIMPKGHPQESSKPKGSSVSIRRRARSWPPRLKEASSTPKRNLEGGGSPEANRDTFRGKSRSSKSDLSPAVSERDLSLVGGFEPKFLPESYVSLVHPSRCQPFSSIPLESSFAVQRGSFFISPVLNISRRGGASCSEGVVFPLETSNRKFKDRPFLRETLSNPEERGVSGEASPPELEPFTLSLEGFQVEGLTPRKMVKVQSVLESLRIRIVRDNGKGVEGENKSALSADKETKREIWDRRFVSSVWKGRSLEWAALPACGALEGIVILWDSIKFKCTEKVLGSFSVIVKLNSDEEGSFWLTSVYGPNKPLWRKDFWLELQDLYGLTFPRWCVGGDFNVIRRISKKMGDSRLTVNMRCFDEFIRESGLLDPPLRNAAFTWSNMQVDPICMRLDRFENMWLLHPEFKEKFRDWWQECMVEGWEGHKFMRKLKFIKSKLKEWKIVAFGDLRERKKHILSDLGRIDLIEQEENLNLDLVSERTLRRKDLEDLLLKEERVKTLSNIEVIYEEIVNFFGNLYSKPEGDSWKIEGIDWAPISGESAVWLDRPFSEEEVRMAVFQLNKEKAPGPDGFTIAVYQECWDVIKEDLMRVFFEFHTKGPMKWWMRKEGQERKGSLKIDFEKAYDHVGWVKASRGLRQGDPLSHFLFTLVADVLSRLMIRAEETGITEGFLWGGIGLEVSEWPLSYLGLPLGGNPKTIGFWDPVSCLSHIPSYFLSHFKIPVSIASKIEKMQRDFLWSGAGEGKKDHLIRWESQGRKPNSFQFPVSSTLGNLPVTVFHSGHLPHLPILSGQSDRRKKTLTAGKFSGELPATYFSDIDHTRRSAWRRSPTFVKAPEPKSYPRAIFRPATASHAPATRLLLQLRLTPTSLPTSLVLPSEPCTYLFWGFLSPSALQTVFPAKLWLLFLHPNPCTCLGKCSSTFLVVPRRDLRPSPFSVVPRRNLKAPPSSSASQTSQASIASVAQPGNASACLTHTSSLGPWILDSGASDHLSGNKDLFSSITTTSALPTVTLANGSQTVAKGIGLALPLPSLPLTSVLYTPECPFNLISISKLTRTLNCSITFSDKFVTLQDRSTGKTIGIGRESQGLYHLTLDSSAAVCHFHRCSSPHSQSSSDNAREYFSASFTSFMSRHGILHQSSCAHTPQQNGVAERKNRHLVETARTILLHSNVPFRFWGDAVLTACYLINRMPSSVLHDQIPHSLLFPDQPLYFLPPRVFGCTCFVHILTPGQDKLSAKAMKCLFLGYSRLSEGYRCYSLETHRYFISGDVTFFEDSPFFSTTSESLPVSEVLPLPIVSPTDVVPPRPLQVYHRRPRVAAPLPFVEAPADSLPTPSASPAPTLPSPDDLPIAIRKGTRSTRNPHPIYNFLSYHRLSSPYSAFVSAISSVSLPKSTHEALSHLGWRQAMVDEMAALHSNGTWDLVVLPFGKSTVGCRWVYAVKVGLMVRLIALRPA